MDIKLFRKIIKEFEKSTIQKLEISENDFTVKMEKNSGPTSVVNPVTSVQETTSQTTKQAEENNHTFVKSPLVGTFYNSSSPDNPPFVNLNQKVHEGDVLCIIEAMKVMNEIRSPISGIIKKINIPNETMVEFGQPIMEIEAL
ncbi:MAG: acetyl-CoA carboxylase biotin carboxyl carrier protein [Candidatus Izimaplasma sp.]|nr:acetyl-CoA carboxylase biotin carboxyl carrier protein [Candidatus Izimaplasma bacterium]